MEYIESLTVTDEAFAPSVTLLNEGKVMPRDRLAAINPRLGNDMVKSQSKKVCSLLSDSEIDRRGQTRTARDLLSTGAFAKVCSRV